jgi:geranylgeranyl reductase family protein
MSPDLTCDVAVIGAGPAGATAAYLLARHGVDVRLFDKQRFPRPKLCAGLLTWKTIDLIDSVFHLSLDSLKHHGLIHHACRDYRIFFQRSEIGRGRLAFPFHFVDRSIYDHYWLKMAAAAGARVTIGTAVAKVEAGSGRLSLADGRTIQSRIIIGADGVWSRSRRSLTILEAHERRWRRNLAATIETYLDHGGKKCRPDFASLHFGYVPWGYAWSFPGANGQTLGIAGLAPKGHGSIRGAFRDFLKSMDIPEAIDGEWKGYPLPYGNYLRRPAHQRLLLIGDACGLADPLLGEGIYSAHASARIAAQAVIKAGMDVKLTGKVYSDALHRGLIRELRWIKLMRTVLFAGGRHRRYRGLKLFCRLLPKRLEAAVQGQRPFSRLLLP